MRKPRIGVRSQVLGALLGSLVFATGCGPEGAAGPEGEPVLEDVKKPELGTRQDEVVYGVDHRQDVYVHADAQLRQRAHQSTVALMSAGVINAANPNAVTFNAPSLQARLNLCSTERFLDDPTPAFCSGTLIDDDLVLTAGHCISAASCADTRFVFNFYRTSVWGLQTVTTQDIFSCASVVVRQVSGADYAVVRLDRSAVPRFTPAPVRPERAALANSWPLGVIGSGSGIPFKLDSGAQVRDARAGTLDYFVSNLDTFGGNSGSGVYDLFTKQVVGILVRGERDYVSNGSCNVVNMCPDAGCRGEDSTYVRTALDAYCAVASSRRLCGETPQANTFTYERSGTFSATTNTADATLPLVEGQTVLIGTCGLPNAFASGDTYLRLHGPAGAEVAFNDDAFGSYCSYLRYTVPPGGGGNHTLRAGCYFDRACRATVAWSLGGSTYSAANTNSATVNTVNQRFTLTEGQVLSVGTCGLPGASFSGDTYLRLFNPQGALVSLSDDNCGGLGSNIRYVVPAGGGGVYELRAGCFSSTACGGNLAWATRGGSGSVAYATSSTNSATTATIDHALVLSAGQVLTVGTCGLSNAYTPQDTYLRLVDGAGVEVAANDDTCGLASRIIYTAPADGVYEVRAGCFADRACGGTLAYSTQ
jgi:hypothetical protein